MRKGLSYSSHLPADPSSVDLLGSSYRQNLRFLQQVLESSPDCIKVLDLEGRLLYMNHKGQQAMEIDNFVRDVQYKQWLPFWQGEEQEAATAAFEAACRGSSGQFDGYCATAKGTPRWWEVVVTPIFDENNCVEKVLSVSRDITARKQVEQKLEQQVNALDEFASIVSHDLKAPLRGISHLSHWIAEDIGPHASSEVQKNLKLLQQRIDRMGKLINGLLEVARVGRRELPDEAVNLDELLKEIIDLLSPPCGFTISSSFHTRQILCKRLLLSQVLFNLIVNAIKHHNKTAGTVEVIATEVDKYYEVSVSDDGPGIASKYQESIFKLFQTLDDRNDTHNTGIGLALVKKIIEAEGGQLWLDADYVTGSRFCFTWPKKV